MDELTYKIGIGMIPGIGDITAKKLISYCGGVEAVFKERKQALLKIPGIGDAMADLVIHQDILRKAEKEIDFIQRNGISCSFYLDDHYPRRLRDCPDAPVIFYYKGDVDFDHPKMINIVGTRQATQYGKDFCNKLVDELVQRKHNPIIVSGLAYGIDIYAHRAALRNGLLTIAVLGHGLSTIYPAAHRSTAREITQQGALLTEFTSGSIIDRNNFIRRNRLIAGLTDLTIVVESNIKGGALITADIANSYNRDVFAVPGRVTDPCSAGCNWLIRTNRASLLQSIEDIEYLMNWDIQKEQPAVIQHKLFSAISPEEEKIVHQLRDYGPCVLDDLSFRLEMPVSKVSTLLLNLELSGLVRSLPGKTYKMV